MSPRSTRLWLAAILVGLSAFLIGCTGRDARTVNIPTPLPLASGTYIDLQAGWRVSVVTPLLKSGKFLLEQRTGEMQVSAVDNTLSNTIQAGPEFLGYEKSVYSVEERRGGGVHVRFAGAETVRNGKSEPQRRPTVTVFALPRSARYVRLIYLLRSSKTDHNMAVVKSSQLADLQSVTRDVQADPTHGCQTRRHSVCQWIPAGIAVRPELQRTGSADWLPAR